MNFIQYLDSDQLNRPLEFDGEVYTLDVLCRVPVAIRERLEDLEKREIIA